MDRRRSVATRIALAAVVLAVLALSGCPLEEEGVTIADRVNQFVSDLNNNYNQVYRNWHPDTTTRQAAANPATLENKFPSSETYDVSNISVDEGNNRATAVIDSTVSYSNEQATFVMSKDGDDWFIDSLSFDGLTLNAIWQ